MKTLITTILLIVGYSLCSQAIIVSAEKKDQITEYINHFEVNKQLMGNVSIFENGKEILNKTFGSYNDSDKSIYTIGSITKMFTAVLIAQLYEEDKINLKEKLSTYFPQIPNAALIEIGHMLNHTSGLRDYAVKEDSLYFWLTKPVTKDDIIHEITRQGVAFMPGDSLSYSNSAYYLLARILEQEYQTSFKEILSQKIVLPLGLQNTFGVDHQTELKNIANSYQKKDNEWQVMEEFYFPNASGAGDIVSTSSDLNTFLQALFSEQIIKSTTLEKMLPIKGEWFGSGIMQAPFYEHIAYGHGGDTYGTHSVAAYNPDNNLAITYIINGENYPTNDFAIGLLSIIYDKEYTLPEFKEYKPEKRFYEKYEGIYGAKDFPLNITIYVEDDQLKAQGDGQPSFDLTPTEKHVFEFRKASLKIEFKPFEKMMNLEQGGQVYMLTKQ